MAYIPSIRLSANLENARFGLWIEELHDHKLALVCKMPDSVIRALYRGAESSFYASIVEVEGCAILCLGLKVEDEVEHPFITVMPCLDATDFIHLKQILTTQSATLHCLNELNHPSLSGWCSLESDAAQRTLDKLNSARMSHALASLQLPTSEILRIVNLGLDHFQKMVYGSPHEDQNEQLYMTKEIMLTVDIWEPTSVVPRS